MTRYVAIFLVLAQLAPPVLLGTDPCVSSPEDPCHVEGDGGVHHDVQTPHHDAHALHHGVEAPGPSHQDLGATPGPAHACSCVCHTPLVLHASLAFHRTQAASSLPAEPAGAAVFGHVAPPFRPPRLA